MAEALVEFDYKAQELDELTIKKGDIITNISFKPGGWWEGTLLNGKRGMFPDNFVKLIRGEDGVVTSPSTGRKCKVLFPYKPEKDDELELQVGDIIDIISEVEEGWWKGSLKGRVGVFPSNFVQEITDVKGEREAAARKPKLSRDESGKSSKVMSSASFNSDIQPHSKSENTADLPTLPPKPVKEYCKVIYKYAANNVDELNLHPGDIITIITKEGQDPGWWKGELKGKVGVFPDNFVEMIMHEENSNTEVKTKAKNRVGGMAISKSATTSSISDSLNLSSLSRKFSDSSKTAEDKIPPSVSKKPVLPPPPSKKPTSTLSSAKSIDSSQIGQTSSLGKTVSSSTTTIKNMSTVVTESTSVSSTSSKWTVLESTDISDGLSFSRQSYSLKNEKGSNENSVSGVHISSLEAPSELNLDMVGRTSKKLVHPTATRAKAPKRRPPSAIYNLSKEELKNGGEEDEDVEEEEEEEEETEAAVLVNGDAESHREAERPTNTPPPWVEELKLNQAKKSLNQHQGKTRVMIGMTERSVTGLTTSERTISSTEKSMSMGVSERVQAAERACERSVAGSPPEGKVILRQAPSSGQPRPQSMLSALRPSPSSPPSSDSVTLSLKQWNQVLDRLTACETEIGSLSKTVKELSSALEDERQRRAFIQQELEKLTDLVTQV